MALNEDYPNETVHTFAKIADVAAITSRHHALDSIACYLHNEGYSLDGNTAESDVEWFAAELYRRRSGELFELCHDKEYWRELANRCLEMLPSIVDRISHRYIAVSRAVHAMARAAREAEKAARKEAGL